jgi:hypothetical protein
VRRKSRCIELDRHFSHFCGALGIPATTGPRGSLPMLREQLQRLFASIFQCIYHSEGEACHAAEGFLIAEKRALWWDPAADSRDADSSSFVELSERFFLEATQSPVPLDIRVLRTLRSPFEIDLYVWLTWRFFRLRKPVTIPWESLMLQFGCGYSNPRHFRKRLLDIFATSCFFYPEARLESRPAGLLLKPSPTHVPQRVLPMKL